MRDRRVRHQDGVVLHALRQARAHVHARQQPFLGVGEDRAQGHAARGLVHRDLGEFQLARRAIFAAVFEDQPHRHGIVGGALQPARVQIALQCQPFGAGLGEVDIDGVQLLHDGEGAGLVGRDQRARRHGGAADAPGDGGFHFGVIEIDLRLVQRGPGGGDRSLRLTQRGDRLVVGLLADGIGFHQFGIAVGGEPRGVEIGLGTGQLGLGAVVGGAIGCRIDAVEELLGLYRAAFLEGPLEDDAGHLRPHLGDQERRGAARQFRLARDAPGLDREHRDGRRGLGAGPARCARLLAAGGQENDAGEADQRPGATQKDDLHG